jgi:hypothetical protein
MKRRQVSELGLKNEEQELVRLVGKFARDFAELPQLHPADMSEVAFRVHHLARIVCIRAAQRAHPELVPNRSGTSI